jgi:membrane protein DedA with SNARE-associated domain
MGGVEHYLALAEPYVRDYGYAAVFMVLFLESFGFPLPGESLVVAGALLAAKGDMHIVPLLGVVWLAAVMGDNVGYAIGLFGGRHLIIRHGARIGITEQRLAKVEHFFRRFGAEIVLVARFFAVLRQLNGWTAVWGLGVYLLGHRVAAVLPWVHRFGYAALIAAGLGVVAILCIAYLKKRRRS